MKLQHAEQRKYEGVWGTLDRYGDVAPGEQYMPMFVDVLSALFPAGTWTPVNQTVLDAGCGSGKGGAALAALGFDVLLCDLTDAGLDASARTLPFKPACLWHDLRPVVANHGQWNRTRVDFTYCCDVLEHIPPQFTMLVIDQLLRVTQRGLFLSISLVPDQFGLWVGAPLHQTVQPFVWWRDAVRELGRVVEARDLLTNAVFFVEPPC